MKSRRACESLLFLSGGIGHDRAAVGLGPGGVGGHVGEIPEDAVEQARREKGEQAENALAGEELASALPETSPIEEEKETAALESVSEAIDGSEEELSGEEAEEAEQDESGEEPDEDKSKDQAE